MGDIYYGFSDSAGYDTRQWISRKITEAVSLNGLDWVILGHVDPDADAPATHVPEAFVQSEGGTTWLYVFYACQIGGKPYNYRYNRIRCMRRKVTEDELQKWRNLLEKLPAAPSGGK